MKKLITAGSDADASKNAAMSRPLATHVDAEGTFWR